MALLDFLKRKKEAGRKKPSTKKPEKKPENVSVEKKDEVKPEAVSAKVQPGKEKNVPTAEPSRIHDGKVPTESRTHEKIGAIGTKFSFEAVKNPHISEKATYLSEKDQYVFDISSGCNKNEVKKAVEGIYGVDVLSVNIIKVPAKKRRLGRIEGFKKGYKKAVVRIKNGQKIEIL